MTRAFDDASIRVHARIIRAGIIQSLPGEVRNPFLRGACVISSYVLSRALRDAGFNAKLAGGAFTMGGRRFGHSWVTVGDDIIDITATQFLIGDTVFVPTTKERREYYREYWRGGRILARARRTHSERVKWMLTPTGADRIAGAAYARHALESGDPSVRLSPSVGGAQ